MAKQYKPERRQIQTAGGAFDCGVIAAAENRRAFRSSVGFFSDSVQECNRAGQAGENWRSIYDRKDKFSRGRPVLIRIRPIRNAHFCTPANRRTIDAAVVAKRGWEQSLARRAGPVLTRQTNRLPSSSMAEEATAGRASCWTAMTPRWS